MGIQETQRNFKELAYCSITDHLGMRVGFHIFFFWENVESDVKHYANTKPYYF